MIQKTPLIPHRVRKIKGSFAFIEHRFLRDGFWSSLDHHELVFYLFLVIVGDTDMAPTLVVYKSDSYSHPPSLSAIPRHPGSLFSLFAGHTVTFLDT